MAITFTQIKSKFNLSLDDAAEALNITSCVLRKLCRNYGIKQWPYRKIMYINSRLKFIKNMLNSKDIRNRSLLRAEIQRLEQKKINLLNCTNRQHKFDVLISVCREEYQIINSKYIKVIDFRDIPISNLN
jgi:hypothetical protein